jgi:hypothetical protein
MPTLPLRTRIVAAVAAVALAGAGVWWFMRPARLGLEKPRVVLATGEARLDDAHAKGALVVPTGATVWTGRGSACFSVRASRVCMGANGEAKLAELGEASAVIESKRGAVVVKSAGDEIAVGLGAGRVTVKSALVAIEPEATPGGPVVRVLEGKATVAVTGKPPVELAAPDAIGMMDGKKRPAAERIEGEERGVAQVASRWQGSAGAILELQQPHARIDVDGADVGVGPVSILLDEGSHTYAIHDGARDAPAEKVELKAGEKVTR